jgi:hypothetical protein
VTTLHVVDAGAQVARDALTDLAGDPLCGGAFVDAFARSTGRRAVVVLAEGRGWRAAYPLLLVPTDGHLLARSPDYGGPWIERDGSDPSVPELRSIAAELREQLDTTLARAGVASEVLLLSPWLPGRDVIAAEWRCRAEKTVAVVALDGDRWSGLHTNRRRDVKRARERLGLEEQWTRFDEAAAVDFARGYDEHMERVDAEARWRLDAAHFDALATSGAELWLSTARNDDGGASLLFVVAGERATYLYGTRWGDVRAASTLAHWHAQEQLGRAGVRELLLGGGVTTDPDDSLLRFKRSWGGRDEQLFLGARVYDQRAHDAAVEAALARPLPEGVVAA